MADFGLEIVSGPSLVSWTDPVTGSTPSRINPLPSLPHKYYLLTNVATPIVIACRVGGVLAPLDGLLGGRLFFWAWVDRPYEPMPPIPMTPGQSSQIIFAANTFSDGHFTIQALRPSGGAVAISFDVDVP